MVKKKNAITLLALVITIVIMLLLAGVAIQMTMGENGLIAKSAQAQKKQAKAELYEIAKLSYINLKAKATENGQPSPNAELALSTTEFTNKYNIVGDDVTDKNGNVIETKANVLNVIQGTVAGGFSSGTTPGGSTPAESWPKTVGGVVITEEDKDKMILKLRVKNKVRIPFGGSTYSSIMNVDPIEVDYGDGEKGELTDLYTVQYEKEYNPGEYVLKFKNIKDFSMRNYSEYEIEILQWGKILEKNEENIIIIPNVSKIYEPEPDRIPIKYEGLKLTEIPEWLFSKKVTSKVMSKFWYSNNIKSIPERLFEKNVNATNFNFLFNECEGITSIPEKLFENNVKAISFEFVFFRCSELKSIPENLFKNNINVTDFSGSFWGCKKITNIPEKLFENNVKVTKFNSTFFACEGLTNIPENLFKNNINVIDLKNLFYLCTGITNIPNNIIEFSKRVKNRGGDIEDMFKYTSVANYEKLLR